MIDKNPRVIIGDGRSRAVMHSPIACGYLHMETVRHLVAIDFAFSSGG